MSIETIQKMWILLGGILGTLSFTWLPDWIPNLFSAEGTQVVFAAINAVIAVIQFLPFRTGKKQKEEMAMMSERGKEPTKLRVEKSMSAKAIYAVLPWTKAA